MDSSLGHIGPTTFLPRAGFGAVCFHPAGLLAHPGHRIPAGDSWWEGGARGAPSVRPQGVFRAREQDAFQHRRPPRFLPGEGDREGPSAGAWATGHVLWSEFIGHIPPCPLAARPAPGRECEQTLRRAPTTVSFQRSLSRGSWSTGVCRDQMEATWGDS